MSPQEFERSPVRRVEVQGQRGVWQLVRLKSEEFEVYPPRSFPVSNQEMEEALFPENGDTTSKSADGILTLAREESDDLSFQPRPWQLTEYLKWFSDSNDMNAVQKAITVDPQPLVPHSLAETAEVKITLPDGANPEEGGEEGAEEGYVDDEDDDDEGMFWSSASPPTSPNRESDVDSDDDYDKDNAVSYTHLTLPTTPYV